MLGGGGVLMGTVFFNRHGSSEMQLLGVECKHDLINSVTELNSVDC